MRRKKRPLRNIILICICVWIGVGSYITYDLINNYKKEKDVYSDIKEIKEDITKDLDGDEVKVESNSNTISTQPQQTNIYSKLFTDNKNINPDYIGWITVPNTDIDYPVVMGDSEFYLKHDFYKNPSNNGCIFSEEVSSPFLRHKTILHGHHMKDGSMFAKLKLYRDEDFFYSSRDIKVLLEDCEVTFRVFSAFTEDAQQISYKVDFDSGQDFIDNCKILQSKSMYATAETFTENDRILVLSTCSYETDISRLVVCAKLVK